MSNGQTANVSESITIVKRNRFFGVVIVLMVLAPMLAAYIMYQTGWGISSTTTNKGVLLSPPTPIQDLRLVENTSFLSDIFTQREGGKKWRLLIPVTKDCSEICQQNLYISRQVHIRLAEKAYRVERIVLSLDNLSLPLKQEITQKHPNTLLANTSVTNFSAWANMANVSSNAEDYYYLVDQDGFAMMRYDVSHTGQDLLDDIKRLLKFTYDK